MVLVDRQIREVVKSGHLVIENFEEDCLQPATYDLRIGPLVYTPSSPTPDKTIDISSNGGCYRIQPYGTAVLMTYETLKLPSDMIGRFGLKSGFARRGLIASTGPQVDPGFDGKLFVSIMNLTPASHIVSYKETFLTIEFHKLDEIHDKLYEGPYQHKRDINTEILKDMTRFEGVNLSQMQDQFTDLSQHVKAWSGLAAKFEVFLEEMHRQTNVLSELVRQAVGVPSEKPLVVEARQIDISQAKNEILTLFKKRRRLYYSDIAETLQLSYETVIQACEELHSEGRIEGEKNEKKKAKRAGKKNIS